MRLYESELGGGAGGQAGRLPGCRAPKSRIVGLRFSQVSHSLQALRTPADLRTVWETLFQVLSLLRGGH